MLAFPTIHLAKTMPSRPADNAIMSIREVGDYLKLTERTIYRLLLAKRLPGFKVGGSWRFKMVDIDLWIKIQSENLATFGVAAALGERE